LKYLLKNSQSEEYLIQPVNTKVENKRLNNWIGTKINLSIQINYLVKPQLEFLKTVKRRPVNSKNEKKDEVTR
jgi:hypothetical protein